MRRRDGERGFTLLEILISLTVMTVGLAGVMSFHMSAIKGNALSQRLDRARMLAEQMMEELRSMPVDDIETQASQGYADWSEEGGAVTYHRQVTVTALSTNLARIRVEVSYDVDGDTSDTRTARLEVIRTRQEIP
ncbi:MAG: prepilin-type N-terminal cleavage/methylation domain-containing protein [Deltaproteobacteria bacterium]|nr:prepilin-type N-terminal cleavage/methylation domain-containing protein [Deltaproteobacteria bacterium]